MVLVIGLFFTIALFSPAAATVWDSVSDSLATRADTLTFSDALARVKRGPALRALGQRATATRATVAQAGAWPNPLLLAEAENVDGSYDGVEQAEFSLWFVQEFELGGKRGRRVDQSAALANASLGAISIESFEIYTETKLRFAAVVHAEEAARIARDAHEVVAELARVADERVRAGATLIADASLAAAERSRTRLAADLAEAERERARAALAALWGESKTFDDPVPRATSFGATPLPVDSARAWARTSPAVAQVNLAGDARRADAALERSLRVPNLALGLGARRVEADDATTLLFSAGVPLPLWDRRGRAVEAADAAAHAADLDATRVAAETEAALSARMRALASRTARLHESEQSLAPSLATALDNMRTAYTIGRVSYSDLLDVQRALLSVRAEINDARLAIVEDTVAIERLCGRTIEELTQHE